MRAESARAAEVDTPMIPFSVLDLAPITQGSDAATALGHTLDLARHAERLGYVRFWLAEHHNMPGIASAATAVVIAHVAGGTRTIRVGAGGIMLPNHAPLVVAEQFGTLEALFPGRIDLGLGRAPGTDHATARALRRTLVSDPDAFPQDILELMSYFATARGADGSRRSRNGIEGSNLHPGVEPVRRARGCGVRHAFRVRVAFCAGDADAGSRDVSHGFPTFDGTREPLRHSRRQRCRGGYRRRGSFPRIIRSRGLCQPAPGNAHDSATAQRGVCEGCRALRRPAIRRDAARVAMVGSPSTVRQGLRRFIELTRPDEIMIVSHIYDHAKRLRSFEIAAEIRASVA